MATEDKPRRLSQKQETFCLKYFELGNATEAALVAGYSPKTARSIASQNLTKLNISARIQELQQAAASIKIMDVVERKERLTEIGREDITSPKTGTLQRMGNIGAIQELNKMEKIYGEGIIVNVDNRKVDIHELSTEELLRIIKGKGNKGTE